MYLDPQKVPGALKEARSSASFRCSTTLVSSLDLQIPWGISEKVPNRHGLHIRTPIGAVVYSKYCNIVGFYVNSLYNVALYYPHEAWPYYP